MIKTMENSNTYIYYSYLFGPREPWQWLFLSDTFQFIIYVILSYPFAWAICIIASISSNKWKHFSDFLAQFIMLALWLLRLWLILFLQIYIRKLFAKFGMTGTIIAIGAAVAVFTGIGAGIGIGIATSKATEAVARQPEAEGKISKLLLLGCALAEATAIYGFVIALLIILLLG